MFASLFTLLCRQMMKSKHIKTNLGHVDHINLRLGRYKSEVTNDIYLAHRKILISLNGSVRLDQLQTFFVGGLECLPKRRIRGSRESFLLSNPRRIRTGRRCGAKRDRRINFS
jgi:hypothetical protein